MRRHLGNAEMDAGQALVAVMEILRYPPMDTQSMNRAKGKLASALWHLDREVEEIKAVARDLLAGPGGRVAGDHAVVMGLLDSLEVEEDRVEFSNLVGRMLNPLRRLQDTIREMERIRFEHSKMRRR